MVVPPQGVGGGAPLDAGVLEDSYIARFKALDPKVARLFGYAEALVSAGVLSVDDVVKYANDVLSTSAIAQFCDNVFSISFSVSILTSAYMPISKAVEILSDVNLSANKTQSILYNMVDQRLYDMLFNIITFDAPDASYTANTTLSTGVNRYRNLSIASGVTLTLGAEPGVIIANSITNSGTIASGWIKGAGGAGVCGGGNGGGGSGAVIILVASDVSVGTVISNGVDGANSTSYSCDGKGSPGGGGGFWLISGDSVPSGGNGGDGGAGNKNGGGGGRSGGAGGSANVTTFTDAPSLLNKLFKAVCDWWLVNVTNKTPSSTVSISLGGSGGGGGGGGPTSYTGGGGGGGGGQIIIYGTSVIAGSVQAKGGNGGVSSGTTAYCGGGGGGGIIYVFYKNLTGTFTYDVSGGTTSGLLATAGGAGVFRAIPV